MYIVKHKNPKHPDIVSGKEWAIDGVGENWTKHDAEQFALRAMYVARKIEHVIEELNETEPENKSRKRKVHSVQPADDYDKGQESSIESFE